MIFNLDTTHCFDGENDEDVRVTFRYVPAFAGTFYDPPHGDDVEIEKAHRLHVPLEELDEPELRGICASGRINEECVNHARNFYIDEAESAAEYRRDMKEDR